MARSTENGTIELSEFAPTDEAPATPATPDETAEKGDDRISQYALRSLKTWYRAYAKANIGSQLSFASFATEQMIHAKQGGDADAQAFWNATYRLTVALEMIQG